MQFKTLCSMAGLLLLLAVQAGAAETVRELRLEDCVRLALEQNKDYIIAEKEVEAQKAGVRAAFAARLPSLNLSGRYTMLDPGTVDDATMTVGAPFFLDPVEVQNAYTHNWAVGLSAQYAIPWIPFFSEGGWGRARLAHEMSKRSLVVAENSLKKIRMDVQSEVKKAFYGLLIAEKVYEVTTANERRVKAYLEVSEANFNAGRVSEYDVLRSRVQLANMRPRVMMAEDTIKLATMALLQQIGEDLDTKITVRGELDEGFITVEEKDALEQALANRVELQELALAVEILKLQERLAAAGV
jgi:outer membrane protein